MPKFLLINLPSPKILGLTMCDYYIADLLEKWSFNLEVGGRHIISIPFLVMNALESYSITPNNKPKLTIPFEKVFSFSNGIPSLCLGCSEVYVRLIKNQPNTDHIISGKIIYSGKYLNTNERRIMCDNHVSNNNNTTYIKEIHSLNLDSQTASKEFDINGFGLLNGIIFQITTPNTTLENISKINILLNGHSRLEWDTDLLNSMAHRLSPKSFYINPNMNGVSLLSPIDTNTLNLSSFKSFHISIETDLETGFNISAHFIVNNKITFMKGMMGKEIRKNFIINNQANQANVIWTFAKFTRIFF